MIDYFVWFFNKVKGEGGEKKDQYILAFEFHNSATLVDLTYTTEKKNTQKILKRKVFHFPFFSFLFWPTKQS